MPPNTAAAVAYITFIPALIFLLIDPYKRINFVRFHAWQCLLFNIGCTVLFVCLGIVSFLFALVHLGIISLLLSVVYWVLMLAFFILWIITVIKASKGERFHIPVIGGIAENMANKQ